jgi:hypothetical protein
MLSMKIKWKWNQWKQNKTAPTTAPQHLHSSKIQTASKQLITATIYEHSRCKRQQTECPHLTAHECTNSSVWQQWYATCEHQNEQTMMKCEHTHRIPKHNDNHKMQTLRSAWAFIHHKRFCKHLNNPEYPCMNMQVND